ncbi:hypothetical protein Bpfe_010678 [Biomphalaria pfeifferi]|uniref:Uncharacterized protein n=1 Tax=Biomphalaria pfeifferi TaxID=112525 RepID=A0AAD8BS58_BIOPF|nr:hypothetical protein Bpfe_010678 [Biomphalaria pfeifferi]
MGCGASSVYSGTKGALQHTNRNIRINIIEATSIIDYEDTDTISSRRQTPVISWQSQVQPIASDKLSNTLPKVMTSQEDSRNNETVERPPSPVPQNTKLLHRTSASSLVIKKNE